MKIVASFSVERIENGWVVRDLIAERAKHVSHNFDIARQIERFMHEYVEQALKQSRIMEDPAGATSAAADLNTAKAP